MALYTADAEHKKNVCVYLKEQVNKSTIKPEMIWVRLTNLECVYVGRTAYTFSFWWTQNVHIHRVNVVVNNSIPTGKPLPLWYVQKKTLVQK